MIFQARSAALSAVPAMDSAVKNFNKVSFVLLPIQNIFHDEFFEIIFPTTSAAWLLVKIALMGCAAKWLIFFSNRSSFIALVAIKGISSIIISSGKEFLSSIYVLNISIFFCCIFQIKNYCTGGIVFQQLICRNNAYIITVMDRRSFFYFKIGRASC